MSNTTATNGDDERGCMEDIEISHLAGFVDGSVTLSIKVNKNKDYSLNYTMRPQIQFSTQNTDNPILGKIMAYCDEYGVKHTFMEPGPENNHNRVTFTVREPDSVIRFLEPMLPFLTTKYFVAEMMIEEVVPAIKEGKHRDKRGFVELMGFAEQFRRLSKNSGSTKYDQDYFAEKWSVTQ